MDILKNIVAYKKSEVAEKKILYPYQFLEKSVHFDAPVVSFKEYIKRKDKSGIISEIKRKSPSKGYINKHVNVEKISVGYMQAGASALSVLTDTNFFGGSLNDLTVARTYNYCPILRKDFIIDEYQIIEARSIGADAILLISAILSKDEIKRFVTFAQSLQMEVLLEVHNKQELEYIHPGIDIVGVNNRDLTSFTTDIALSLQLVNDIPNDFLKISESGINTVEEALLLKNAGFNGFLIGEQFMKYTHPEIACAQFIKNYKKMSDEN